MVDIAVIDYGMGNLRSVHNALSAVAPDASIVVTGDPDVVAQAGRVVFPGQGAMPDCMRELDMRNLRNAVLDAAHNKPFLGICIGLQMLFERSTEGDVPCLGVLPGQVVRFGHDLHDAEGNRLKVPHMGWNQVHYSDGHPLWQGIAQDERFYFVHSYYVQPSQVALVQAESNYPLPFVCAVARDNLFAVQFHPEKSHTAGLQLLKNFASWNPV
ncbi:MAG: imidazole glycerol phosphate synthase subunit HisH [Gallionellales bacterium 35-53-114]|jgi:glutamine amidotransferase|nr:MAG: imidazole glycerol phosphate synthase subunit HisH [Gallionellales bacterium 35-53-114]OYZ64191.1 MAG: imidazole glycerol phosphate synthase subunit HisH [Gallionellales bacterium 24-53-125]OZB10500.1 MAG: imidazole glycerol phosphate synthase subunit HisH [Gallionellales bacterium 39-52-133]HQS57119.1 imidazole glycerol phosphate synthase subunit HisH [Gallionellaceae bacterium]HQS74693.1 imidazole glycerol phosphate synthase subunit HisH [Gallionellaceae bacterium]